MQKIVLFSAFHSDNYVIKTETGVLDKVLEPSTLRKLSLRYVHRHDATSPSRDHFHSRISNDGYETQVSAVLEREEVSNVQVVLVAQLEVHCIKESPKVDASCIRVL